MPIAAHILQSLLESAFPTARVEVRDMVGDQNHYEVCVTSSEFQGISAVMRHRRIHHILRDILDDGTLHAVSIRAQVED